MMNYNDRSGKKLLYLAVAQGKYFDKMCLDCLNLRFLLYLGLWPLKIFVPRTLGYNLSIWYQGL